jgi:hypothetical protein
MIKLIFYTNASNVFFFIIIIFTRVSSINIRVGNCTKNQRFLYILLGRTRKSQKLMINICFHQCWDYLDKIIQMII